MIRQQQFEYAYIFGAVCPALDKAVGLVLLVANTDAMLIHLEHISAAIPQGRHAVLVLDQATWHTTKRLKKFNNLTLLSLPPASPELNPTEKVWQTLRDKYLANRCYKNYDDSYKHLVMLGTGGQMFQEMFKNCVLDAGLICEVIFWIGIK